MSGKITTWIKEHFSLNKIDYMSLNRLRLNLTATSSLPVQVPYTEKTRIAEGTLLPPIYDASFTFGTMAVILNPYGMTPLTALVIFHTDIPCRLSYTVKGTTADTEFTHSFKEMATTHVAPIFGLYPNTNNLVAMEIFNESGESIASRTIQIRTGSLTEQGAESANGVCPLWRDSAGEIRYFLTLPSHDAGLIPLSGNRFLTADADIRTRTGKQPLPTHLYELDLLGRVYRTFYVGSGICQVYGETEPGGSLLVSTLSSVSQMPETILELDRQTGAVIRSWNETDLISITHPVKINRSHLEACSQDSLHIFMKVNEELAQMEYVTTGWLNAPALYKAASVETSAAVDLAYMADTYQMTFALCGDTLLIGTIGDQIQEIVFSKTDRIYQLDLTNPPQEDDRYEKYRYTLAIPFTEMYSGTYSIVIRFRDGGQEVLTDTLLLSRTRKPADI